MLDPAGDSRYAGRIIGESFERGISAQFSQAIKKELENLGIKVIISRYPGESTEPLNNVFLANKLNVDFYVNINFYHEPKIEKNNNISIYYSLYNPVTDLWDLDIKKEFLNFMPYNKAYKRSVNQSKQLADILFKNYKNPKAETVLGIPFRPLVGLLVPGIGIEIGLNKSDDWSLSVDQLVSGLKDCLETGYES